MPTYAYETQHTSPNRNKRPAGQEPESITIHHWGKDGQRFDNVRAYLCDGDRPNPTSAHYVAEAGRVACIVDPDERAWHAGTTRGNDSSIGIECRPEASDGDYATVAELVRNLRDVYGNLPLVEHGDWKPTACPGRWDLARIDREARSGSSAAAPAPSPAPPAAPKPAAPKSTPLRRGSTGPRVERLQRTLRTRYPLYAKHLTIDGRFGPQTERVVREYQDRAGLVVDGVAGPATHAALGLSY